MQVVEQGTHAELLEQRGAYWQLVCRQQYGVDPHKLAAQGAAATDGPASAIAAVAAVAAAADSLLLPGVGISGPGSLADSTSSSLAGDGSDDGALFVVAAAAAQVEKEVASGQQGPGSALMNADSMPASSSSGSPDSSGSRSAHSENLSYHSTPEVISNAASSPDAPLPAVPGAVPGVLETAAEAALTGAVENSTSEASCLVAAAADEVIVRASSCSLSSLDMEAGQAESGAADESDPRASAGVGVGGGLTSYHVMAASVFTADTHACVAAHAHAHVTATTCEADCASADISDASGSEQSRAEG